MHMKGTQQGDFSRLLFDRRKHYRAVHLQQGRVQLDSDWNAQVALTRYRQEVETADVVGASAAPAAEAGFGLAVSSCLELGPDKHFVIIGSPEGCRWQSTAPEPRELTIEMQLVPKGNGVIFSRWTRGENGFQLADRLNIEAGRLRYARLGEVELVTEPLAMVDSNCHVAVVSRVDGATLYVDGVMQAEGLSRVPPQSLEKNIFLIGANLRGSTPVDPLDCLFFDFRVLGERRSAEQIQAGIDRPPKADDRLLGWWSFTDGAGSRVRDHSLSCNHGVLRGKDVPPSWLPYRATVSAGRFYVDGLLCENEETVGFESQIDAPKSQFPHRPGVFLFYLDAWEREVQAIEDPELREIALGGPDTTTRSRAIAQVEYLELTTWGEEDDPRHSIEWQRLLDREKTRGKLRARLQGRVSGDLDNHLYRVEIHHPGWSLGGPRPLDGDGTVSVEVSEDGMRLRLAPEVTGFTPGQPVEVFVPGQTVAGEEAVVEALEEDGSLRLDRKLPLGGVAAVRPIASFKWSRDNGSRCYPIAGSVKEGDTELEIGVTARGLDLCSGDWVEVLDDTVVLRRQVRHLCQVKSVDRTHGKIYLEQGVPKHCDDNHQGGHPFLRTWDQRDEEVALLASGVRLARANPLVLEKDVQVDFVGNTAYRSGDYWTVATRQLAQDVEWPRNEHGEPDALAPHGVEHHYAPLALLVHDEDGFRLDDLRRTFQPLSTGAVSKAGDEMEGDLVVKAGLEVWDDLEVRGQARIGQIYGRLCGQDMVDTPQLVDGAVTLRKLAPEVGVVPDGYSILGPSGQSPPGYVATGSKLTLFTEQPEWVDRYEIPSTVGGPYASAELDGKIYTLLEAGDLWIYDPAANSWHRGRKLPDWRRRFAVAAVAGKLHVVGGLDAAGNISGEHLVYDPAQDTWDEAEAMPTRRSHLALAVFGGKLHALGGLRQIPLIGWLLGRFATTRHEVYDPGTDTWHRRCAMPEARYSLAAASSGNSIHAVGGERRWLFRLWGRIRTHHHHRYHAGSDSWSERTRLPSPRSDLSLVEVGGRLYAVGGRGPGWLGDCDRYDPGNDHWEAEAPLHEAIEHPGVAAADGTLFVTGARRFPGSQGVLVEACRMATLFHVHRRDFGVSEELNVTVEEEHGVGAIQAEDAQTEAFQAEDLQTEALQTEDVQTENV